MESIKNAKTGDKLKLTTKDGSTYTGILMPRSELADERHVVIKLDSGYNVGIDKDKITGIELVLCSIPKEKFELKKTEPDKNKPKISILATGGTIASRVDYITGGVISAFSADELISAVPELEEIANVSGRQIFNKFSENITPDDWAAIADAVYEEIKKGAFGIVVTHGTDTMGYTAAALSFMLKTPVPVVITGAQRSSDRGSSDAAVNLINATAAAAKLKTGGVFVVMHGESSDSFSLIHPGTKVKKLHSSRRDAFKTVNDFPAGKVENGGIEYFKNSNYYKEFIENQKNKNIELTLDNKLEKKVALIKYFPGMTPDVIENLINSGYKGIIIEGTGLGHVNENLIGTLKKAVDNGIHVFMAIQTMHGRVNMRVYSTGRNLLNAGIVSCEDMLSETALVKLMWVLGHTNEPEKVREMMRTNYAGEISRKSNIE
jgi:glutamyl-tRNA(Gln) amidotransferase subunit D